MSLAQWSLFVGTFLVTMVLAGTLLGRLPLSSSMVYLALGWLLGPDVADVLRPNPAAQAGALEQLAEVALLISLFVVGLQLGVPLRDRRWRLPLRLAFLSMATMVAMITAIGVGWLGLGHDQLGAIGGFAAVAELQFGARDLLLAPGLFVADVERVVGVRRAGAHLGRVLRVDARLAGLVVGLAQVSGPAPSAAPAARPRQTWL